MSFKEKLDNWVEIINSALNNYVTLSDCPQKTIYSAMKYSLQAGGKRLRPILAIAVTEMLDGSISDVMPYACALEMIHTYSLIHDDLPAMDNDDYRRGRLTNHKVFGEATAILAGDALLNKAFEVVLESMERDTSNLPAKVRAAAIVARSAGAEGMIGGQVVDLEAEGKKIPIELLRFMHKCKTGALIKAPVIAAAALCSADEDDIKLLETYADNLGLAFQIKDDILDVEGNFELLGKKIGSDADNDKSTFVSLYGLEKSKEMLADVTKQSISALDKFGEKAWFLRNLAEYLLIRQS